MTPNGHLVAELERHRSLDDPHAAANDLLEKDLPHVRREGHAVAVRLRHVREEKALGDAWCDVPLRLCAEARLRVHVVGLVDDHHREAMRGCGGKRETALARLTSRGPSSIGSKSKKRERTARRCIGLSLSRWQIHVQTGGSKSILGDEEHQRLLVSGHQLLEDAVERVRLPPPPEP